MLQRIKNSLTCTQDASLAHTVAGSRLSSIYFSQFNKDALHEAIRYSVFKATGKTIARQSDNELTIIMRSLYLSDSRNDPNADVLDQVRSLNKKVLDYAVPRVVGELQMRDYYLKDISSQPVPLPTPVSVSRAGTRTLTRDTL